VEWFPTIEASSTDLIEIYVATGLGVGLSVAVPKKTLPAKVKALPLKDFPPALIGALWRGKKTPLLDAFLDMARQQAREIVGATDNIG
jgi:DNA-binding transcriptional LysR family regulator